MKHQFDLITALHLLEHLNEPVQYLMKLKDLICLGGKLIVEVPNLECWLCELSQEYSSFFYLYEHVSYFTAKSLRSVFEMAGYKNLKIYTKELYSVENHINWIRTGKPFISYNQMFLPDERIEFINEMYKKCVEEKGKGFALICEGTL